MWQTTALRSLIALNWIAFALACNLLFVHPTKALRMRCYRLAEMQLARESPQLEPGSEEFWRRSAVLGDELNAESEKIGKVVSVGCWLAIAVSATNAVGLMIVFPGIAAKCAKRADAISATDRDRRRPPPPLQ